MISRAGEIPEQIFRLLRDSSLVIADLTGANPNVMYELGLRHTTGKLTIQIGERGRLPFDVASIRTIMFKRTDAGLVQARKDLAKSIGANLDTNGDPVTATRIWFESPGVQELAPQPEVEGDVSQAGEDDPPGFLELLAEMEDGNQSLVHTMHAAATITEEISAVYTEATASIHEADSRGGGAAARLALANRTANQLEAPAARLEVVAGDYERTVQRIEPGLLYMLNRLLEDPGQLADAAEFPEQIRVLVDAASTAAEGAAAMQKSSLDIGNASRSLKRVGLRLGAGFKKMADASRRIASWRELTDKLP